MEGDPITPLRRAFSTPPLPRQRTHYVIFWGACVDDDEYPPSKKDCSLARRGFSLSFGVLARSGPLVLPNPVVLIPLLAEIRIKNSAPLPGHPFKGALKR